MVWYLVCFLFNMGPTSWDHILKHIYRRMLDFPPGSPHSEVDCSNQLTNYNREQQQDQKATEHYEGALHMSGNSLVSNHF